ncbi:FAD binding domain-containing protein [Bacillus sp. Marseille-P3661]|uniref:FAD binding domain-containing protein n=1 Tax=Bacillus sp. Marseille-P3661 TaxID=1936234 RepID=UPI0015E15F81|nr:xanthine dehydrogenase family protein subunit M [Bacillus sp. Marseille-P3661]
MKPAQFEYFQPSTLSETVSLLEDFGPAAKIIAGGQSLLPLMNFRLARPPYLIDINGVSELENIYVEEDCIKIGALVRHSSLIRDPIIKQYMPVLTDVAKNIGHIHIRNRGTFGGSISHSDAAAELPVASVALDATFRVVGPDGERQIPAEEFFITYLTTALEPGEILVETKIPLLSPGTGYGVQEISRRHGDFALVLVITILKLATDGTCQDARFVIGGVSDRPLRATLAEDYLIGRTLTNEDLTKAAKLAAKECDPESDLHCSAEYRKELVEVIGKKALGEAFIKAKGEGKS